jgi:hypothetical protein
MHYPNERPHYEVARFSGVQKVKLVFFEKVTY